MNTVVILDDDEDVGWMLCRLLQSRLNVTCVSCTSFDELRRNRATLACSALIILDINLGPGEPTGLDAFSWLNEIGYAGKICFLTGHAGNHPLVIRACASGAKIYEKPIRGDQLCAMIREALVQIGQTDEVKDPL